MNLCFCLHWKCPPLAVFEVGKNVDSLLKTSLAPHNYAPSFTPGRLEINVLAKCFKTVPREVGIVEGQQLRRGVDRRRGGVILLLSRFCRHNPTCSRDNLDGLGRYVNIRIAGGEGVVVGEDHFFGAVVAEGGFVVAAVVGGKGVEDVGGRVSPPFPDLQTAPSQD